MRKTLTRAILGGSAVVALAVPAAAQAAPAVPMTGVTNCSTHTYYHIENSHGDVFDLSTGAGPDYLTTTGLGDRFCTKASTVSGSDLLVDADSSGTCMYNNGGVPTQETCGTHPKAEAWGFITGFPHSRYELYNANSHNYLVGNPPAGTELSMGPGDGSPSELWAVIPA